MSNRIQSTKDYLASAIAPSRQGKGGEGKVLHGRNELQRRERIKQLHANGMDHKLIVWNIFGITVEPPSAESERPKECALQSFAEMHAKKQAMLLAYVAKVLAETSDNDD